MPEIVSIRYFPTDLPFRAPGDPGLAAPPEGRPYEIVARHPDGSATHELVHPDRRRTKARDPDAAAVAQNFAHAREALYCRQARAWFVWDGALWRPDRGGTVAQAIEALARAAITDATRGVAPPINPTRLAAEVLARETPGRRRVGDGLRERRARPSRLVTAAAAPGSPPPPSLARERSRHARLYRGLRLLTAAERWREQSPFRKLSARALR